MKKISIIGLSGNSIFYQLDNLPVKGETKKAQNIYFELGGKGMNQAVACARQGMKVSFLSAIGDDIYGKECIEFMNTENVDAYFVKKSKNTATASILKDSLSNNEVIVYQGANEDLNLKDLDNFKDEIKTSDILLLTYEIPYEVLKYAIKIAKETNTLIVLNPAPYIYDDFDILKEADIITPNEVEAKMIFNVQDIIFDDINKKIKDIHLKTVVITLGDKGAVVFKDNNYMFIESRKVEAVDTTGAGDVFNSSLCAKLITGEDIISSVKYANLVSSMSVKKNYVMNSIPTIKEIMKEIENEK